MHTIKITPNLLFDTSGKFIRLANRIETFFYPNWNALLWTGWSLSGQSLVSAQLRPAAAAAARSRDVTSQIQGRAVLAGPWPSISQPSVRARLSYAGRPWLCCVVRVLLFVRDNIFCQLGDISPAHFVAFTRACRRSVRSVVVFRSLIARDVCRFCANERVVILWPRSRRRLALNRSLPSCGFSVCVCDSAGPVGGALSPTCADADGMTTGATSRVAKVAREAVY